MTTTNINLPGSFQPNGLQMPTFGGQQNPFLQMMMQQTMANNPFMQQMAQQMMPQQQTLESRVAKLESAISKQPDDLEKRLAETDAGCKYLRAKYDGAVQVLIEFALANPLMAQRMNAFLDGWKKDAQAFLEGQG